MAQMRRIFYCRSKLAILLIAADRHNLAASSAPRSRRGGIIGKNSTECSSRRSAKSDLGVLVTGSLAERGLRRGEASDRHAEGRARDIIEADLVTERD